MESRYWFLLFYSNYSQVRLIDFFFLDKLNFLPFSILIIMYRMSNSEELPLQDWFFLLIFVRMKHSYQFYGKQVIWQNFEWPLFLW